MKKRIFLLGTRLFASMVFAIGLQGIAFAEQTSATKQPVNETEKVAKKSAIALCNIGKNQSPVNIDSKKSVYITNRLRMAVKFNYGQLIPKTITRSDSGLRITVGEGATLEVDDKTFSLKHLDFHMPSENTVNNKHFPMEIEFYHEAKDQPPAIVSMMVIPGKPDRTLRKIMGQFPSEAGKSAPLAANTLKTLEMKKKLANYYRYSGSLTSTHCTEGVRWIILKQPLSLSDEQQKAFKKLIGKDNNRPVQPLNARQVIE